MSSRPPLDVAALRAGLPGLTGLEVTSSCPSTNALLLQSLAQGHAEDLSVLVAEHQVAGQGRLGRTWVTPPRAALTLSVGLTPTGVLPKHLGWLALLGGVAVVDTLAAVGLSACLKWPNDVLLVVQPPGRPGKVCGILASGTADHAVLGIGLNTSQAAQELPAPGATSIMLASGSHPDRTQLLLDLLGRVLDLLRTWRQHQGDPGRSGVRDMVRDRTATLGQQVRAELPGGSDALCGTAIDIDAAGRLVIRTDGGQLHCVAAGDVHHVRPRCAA